MRQRLDILLVERNLCESRAKAQALIMAGEVIVDGHSHLKPSTQLPSEVTIQVKRQDHGFVSRGGMKLAHALHQFSALVVKDRICMDVGASTGGFSDCLLQHGAARIYAIDVGYGQLAWKLVNDPRVVVLDRQNIRMLSPDQIGEPVDVVVIDCSFISLVKVLPCLPQFLANKADIVALIKPQFEVGPKYIGKKGVVRDPEAHRLAQKKVEDAAWELGFTVQAQCESPIEGREGNKEFLLWLCWNQN